MGELLLSLALNCAAPEMVNVSKYPWNQHDLDTLEYSKRRCAQLHSDAPCVKLFRKFDYQDYSVICGKKL